jgi:hypothetical protein
MPSEGAFMAAVLAATLAMLVLWPSNVHNTVALLIGNVLLAFAVQWRRRAAKRRR